MTINGACDGKSWQRILTFDFFGGLAVGIHDWSLPGAIEVGLDAHGGW